MLISMSLGLMLDIKQWREGLFYLFFMLISRNRFRLVYCGPVLCQVNIYNLHKHKSLCLIKSFASWKVVCTVTFHSSWACIRILCTVYWSLLYLLHQIWCQHEAILHHIQCLLVSPKLCCHWEYFEDEENSQ